MDAVLLKLHEMWFDNVLRFPFVESTSTLLPLSASSARNATSQTWDSSKAEDGKLAAKLPVDPTSSAGSRSKWNSSAPQQGEDGLGHFLVAGPPISDHITHLNALHAFMRTQEEGRIDLDRWCFDYFNSQPALDEVCYIRASGPETWS
ncbi:hypothetical protein Daus18300_002550 [Diaporthe australafricana]|uniref:Uncharacterized protein n=1 Tax=Diaporthe australafricana TaxID=127596 RepID=A0ABR3XMS6_9PEZI